MRVPLLQPPDEPQPPWVWIPIALPVLAWMIGEPELPPEVSVV